VPVNYLYPGLTMRTAFFILLALACTCQAQTTDPTFTTVFQKGEAGYTSYRIPAIIATKQHTLLAFIEARKDSQGDAGNIDLLVKRSVDHGKTWGPAILVWDDKNNTCGNPAPVVDQSTGTIWLLLTWNFGSDHEGAIKAGTSKHPRHVYVSSSTDDGNHWVTPTCISSSARKDHWRWYATGPGNGIQLTRGPHKGRLVIPCNHSDHSNTDLHPYRSHIVYSDDHGKHWQIGAIQPEKTNESAVAELSNGGVLQSMRSYHGKHNRAMAISNDGGSTFAAVYLDNTLQTPVCQGSILRHSFSKTGHGILLHSNPAGQGRDHLTISMSQDDGKTWPWQKVVYAGGGAYSNLVGLPDGQVGILFEKDNYQTVAFTTFSINWIRSKQ
jgi:sialidase-1